MNLRDNIKKYCKLRKMTQKELAEKLGVTDVSLNATLKEGKDPRLSTLQKIADVLEIKITDLLSDGTEQTIAEEQPVAYVPYIRCPHCGKEIDLYVKAREEHQE